MADVLMSEAERTFILHGVQVYTLKYRFIETNYADLLELTIGKLGTDLVVA